MNENKTIVWLQMEFKRAAAMLPLILRRAMILTAVCLIAAGMIAFCVKTMWAKHQRRVQITNWLYCGRKYGDKSGSFLCAEYGVHSEHL